MHWLTPLPGQGAGAFSWKLPTPPPDMTKMMLAAGQAALEKGVEFGIAAGEAGYGAAKVGADVTMKGAKLAGQAGVVAAQAGYEGAKVGADVTLKVGTKAAELGVAAAVVGAEGTVVAVKYTAKRTKGAVHKTHKLGVKAAGHFERYSETLEEAGRLGYAEADPTADVEGFDAAAKAAILASLAFHSRVTASDVHREGISEVTAADVNSAREMGCVVKLLAICELRTDLDGGEAVAVRVHPAMIPVAHPLASVRGAYNAVFVESDAAGELMFYGPGAGGAPTASAVLGDLVSAARNHLSGTRGAGESAYADRAVLPMGETRTRYHVAIDVDDRAGVLATVALAFAEHGVSIQTVRQEGRDDDAQLVVVSHWATDAQLSATVEHLRGLDIVREVTSVMRVEGGDE